jgi:hypothetical protein
VRASIEQDRHVTEGWARSLASLVLFLGVVAAAVGVILPVNQATTRSGAVPVVLSGEHPVGAVADVALPEPLFLAPATDAVDLHADDLPRATAALTEADDLVVGLLILVGAWLLARVLRDISAGRPFAPGAANRITGIAVVVAAAGLLPEAVRTVATIVVLERYDLGPGSGIGFGMELDLSAFLLAAVLFVVAEVFRQGTRLAADTEGLV